MTATRQQVRRLVRKYQRLMGLDGWYLEVEFETGLHVAGEPLTATCEARHRYQDAILTFDLRRIKQTGEDLDLLVRHEMLHIPTYEISTLAEWWAGDEPTRQKLVEAATEFATTLLERMPVWGRRELVK